MRNRSIIILLFCVFFLNGCAVVFQKGRASDIQRIESLKDEVGELKSAKDLLGQKLSQEIANQQVRLNMAEKGLVITFVAEILFDSGKDKLRNDSLPILDKVVEVLNNSVPDNKIGVEGHTDNVPIKYSGWKSNWELSAHRALSVLYHLQDQGVGAGRLSAIGYGEHQPVSSNATKSGRQLNRRVEIVILPKASINKKTRALEQEEYIEVEEENLK